MTVSVHVTGAPEAAVDELVPSLVDGLVARDLHRTALTISPKDASDPGSPLHVAARVSGYCVSHAVGTADSPVLRLAADDVLALFEAAQ